MYEIAAAMAAIFAIILVGYFSGSFRSLPFLGGSSGSTHTNKYKCSGDVCVPNE